jgi:imidazoleglycerol-phosphate dehydratase
MAREARIERKTKETEVSVNLRVDGTGEASSDTGLPFLDHMIEQLGKHGRFDLRVVTRGDLEVDGHHTVEDTGIALGQALSQALGDKTGIRRFASVTVPLDESLVEVALDISGRPFLVWDVSAPAEMIGNFDTGLAEDFVQAFSQNAGLTLHVRLISGRSPHHVLEAAFKAMANALRDACAVSGDAIPSTKGSL